jgi:hypothetical protein
LTLRNLIGVTAAVAALWSAAPGVRAQPAPGAPRVGDAHQIIRTQETSQRTSDGSSGSSRDNDAIVERVIGVRADGLELEYDLPKEVSAEDRARTWQFPARVFKPDRGPPQLLNRPELEARVDRWLKKAKWSRSVCGRWIFTWTAFRIDCDPESVIRTIEMFDPGPADLRDGAAYQMAGARAPGTVVSKASDANGAVFAVELAVDPDFVHRTRAESDVAVGEMMGKPVSLDAALAERAREVVSGTIVVTFEAGPAGDVRRRTTVTTIEIKGPNDRSETQTVTETLERERLPER